MTFRNTLNLAILFLPLIAMAQPPEEIPPVYNYAKKSNSSDSSAEKVSTETTSKQVSTTSTEQVQVVNIPATSPAVSNVDLTPPPALSIPKTKSAEDDDTMKGLKATFSLGLFPVGFDNLNLDVGTPGETSRYFFQFQPGVELNSKLLTSSGKKVDVGASYSLLWREYYNKADTTRDMEHDVTAFLGTRWNDLLSSKLDVLGVYFFKAGADAGGDNALLVDTNGALTFNFNKNVSAKIGYWNRYLNLIGNQIPIGETNSITETPGDIDDFRRGGLFNDSTYDASNNSYIDPYSGEVVNLSGDLENKWMLHNSVVLGTTINPQNGTKFGITYKYTFLTLSNDDSSKWTGHFIAPGISQDMPWKGGNASLGAEMRLRHFDFKKTSNDPSAASQDLRNRITFEFNQSVNDFVSLQTYFRWELNGGNNDDYNNLKNTYHLYLGTNLTF